VVLTPMLHKHVSVTYNYMFSERQLLYCGKDNTLFHLQDDRILGEEIINSQYAGRSYMLESKPPSAAYRSSAYGKHCAVDTLW